MPRKPASITPPELALPADPNDPEDFDATAEDVERALEARRKRLRGPQKAPTKTPVSIRLDPDVIAALRATGQGWQARANDLLRKGMKLD